MLKCKMATISLVVIMRALIPILIIAEFRWTNALSLFFGSGRFITKIRTGDLRIFHGNISDIFSRKNANAPISRLSTKTA